MHFLCFLVRLHFTGYPKESFTASHIVSSMLRWAETVMHMGGPQNLYAD